VQVRQDADPTGGRWGHSEVNPLQNVSLPSPWRGWIRAVGLKEVPGMGILGAVFWVLPRNQSGRLGMWLK
jgi:hypothetical protein